MGLYGIVKGVTKVVIGIVEGDISKIAKGVGQTALGTATTVVDAVLRRHEKIINNETDDVLDD